MHPQTKFKDGFKEEEKFDEGYWRLEWEEVELLYVQLGGIVTRATLYQASQNWAYEHTKGRVSLISIHCAAMVGYAM